MARIERATSPLPRGCSTTEPHGHRHRLDSGEHKQASDDINATQPTTTLERETGIEPASSAWKAGVLPLNYSRPGAPTTAASRRSPNVKSHSQNLVFAWWRRLDSNQRRRKPTDLQSAPFSHSGTPPRRTGEYNTADSCQPGSASCASKAVHHRRIRLGVSVPPGIMFTARWLR